MRRTRAAALVVLIPLLAACGALPPVATIGPPPQPTPSVVATTPATSGGPPQPGGSGPLATAGPVTAAPGAPVPATGSWARVEVDGLGPSAREDHTWTVDGDGAVAYLFGGRSGSTVYGDLWAFDLASGTWRLLPNVDDFMPDGRFGHEAQWIPGLGLAIFAGQAGSTFFNDVWLYSPMLQTWTNPFGGGDVAPIPRYGTCSGVGPDRNLWISHGFTEDGARFSDTRSYDFGTKTWSNESPTEAGPVERCLHACWWTADGRLTLYGGQTTGVPALGDLWRLAPGAGGPSTNAWTELPAPAPPARQLPAVARGGDWTLLIGGRGLGREPLGDAWVLADAGDSFVELALDDGDAPTARSGAALIRDAARNRFLLFGGIDDAARDDLWAITTQ